MEMGGIGTSPGRRRVGFKMLRDLVFLERRLKLVPDVMGVTLDASSSVPTKLETRPFITHYRRFPEYDFLECDIPTVPEQTSAEEPCPRSTEKRLRVPPSPPSTLLSGALRPPLNAFPAA